MKDARQLGWLIVGCVSVVVGCGDTPSADQYQTVSKVDATEAQKALDSAVVSDPMVDSANDVKSDEPAAATKNDAGNADVKPESPSVAESVPSKDEPKADVETVKAASPKPAPKLLIAEKDFATTAPENSLRVTFDDVDLEKVFEIKETDLSKDTTQHFPQWLRKLNGQRVRMRGFMYPPFQATELVGFTLTRDTSACCFGPNPKVCYLIDVWMKKGKTTDYIENRPFDVVGVFRIGEEVAPGKLYTIDDAVVIPK